MNAQSNQLEMKVNRSMPPGTIITELVYAEVDTAVAWLCQTFGFKERLRIGNHRSQLLFGEASIVVVGGGGQLSLSAEVTHSLMVRVQDVDAHYAHASQCGARIINPPTDYPYGERQYTVEDLAGRRWTFSQAIADVDPGEWGGRLIESAEDMV
jgi:uncharacterized glyoxalase superfamily protein PhnB